MQSNILKNHTKIDPLDTFIERIYHYEKISNRMRMSAVRDTMKEVEQTPLTAEWKYEVCWDKIRINLNKLAFLYYEKGHSKSNLARNYGCSRAFITSQLEKWQKEGGENESQFITDK